MHACIITAKYQLFDFIFWRRFLSCV